eukprot:8317_1
MNTTFATSTRIITQENKGRQMLTGSRHQRDKHRDRRRRRHHSRSASASSTDSRHAHYGSSDLHRLNKNRDKKFKKNISTSIQSSLTLGLKYLTTNDPSKAAMNEKAILLRCTKPETTSFDNILKTDNIIIYDYPLLIADIRALYEHEIDALKTNGNRKRATLLAEERRSLMDTLAEDALLIPVTSLQKTFRALFTKHPNVFGVLNEYNLLRSGQIAQAQNQNYSIANVTGFCLKWNFKNKCDNNNCGRRHYCFLHGDSLQSHSGVKCNRNPARWKDFKPKTPRNSNMNFSYGAGDSYPYKVDPQGGRKGSGGIPRSSGFNQFGKTGNRSRYNNNNKRNDRYDRYNRRY